MFTDLLPITSTTLSWFNPVRQHGDTCVHLLVDLSAGKQKNYWTDFHAEDPDTGMDTEALFIINQLYLMQIKCLLGHDGSKRSALFFSSANYSH